MKGAAIRILVFSQHYRPEIGALPGRTRQHALRWHADGHNVRVICQVPNYPRGKIYPGFRNRLFQLSAEEGIEIVRVGVIPRPNRGAIDRILNYSSYALSAVFAGLRGSKPDIVLGSSPQLLTACAAAIVAKLRGAPFILEIRDLWPESIEEVNSTPSGLAVWLLTRVVRRLYRVAEHIVVVSAPFRDYLESVYDVPHAKISITPNGIDTVLVNPGQFNREAIRAELQLDGCFAVAYVGGLGAAHGLRTVLLAAEQLKSRREIRFLIVGDGAERESLESEAARRRLDNVAFLGSKSWMECLSILSAVDVSLVPLRKLDIFRTVIPSKLLEGMAMERPVILGVEGEAARILGVAEAGISVCPEDAIELCDAILRLHDSPDLRMQMGRNGRAYVRLRFNRDELAEKLLAKMVELDNRQHCIGES